MPGDARGDAQVRPIEPGERVLLQDSKGRRYLVTLQAGATFHTHRGRLAHDELIGCPEGEVVSTDLGQRLLVLRPTLADWVVKMPRGAQVIYPRTIALMVMAADVRPGMTVLEAGAGSGALSIGLLQALVPGGVDALAPGGLLVAFVATVPQVMRTVEALEATRRFGLIETSEAILRPWHVEGLAVRPEHRMVGHTGFLVSARRTDEPWPAATPIR